MTATIKMNLASAAATEALGERLAQAIRPGDVIGLSGDLGTGKTTLARGLIQSLTGYDQDVPSPTFTLVQTYETARGPIWHFDLYRLTKPDDIYELGWDDALSDGISLVEWPERLGRAAPREMMHIVLTHQKNDSRVATLTGSARWADRLKDFAPHAR